VKIPSGLEAKRARVEIVPLLDVLLIVLIFLLYLSLTSTHDRSIEVALSPGRGRLVSPAVTVVVTQEDRMLVEGHEVDPAQAVERVTALLRERGTPNGQILLRSDRSSQLGLTVALLTHLEAAGLDNVSVEVDGR